MFYKKPRRKKEETKAVRLHTVDYNGTDYWSSVILNHPATLETMAMDSEAKRELIEDLDMFINSKDYYRRVGRAWKRGYLFYGPPGTGKSSLVAAMANYLKFDAYDLDLRENREFESEARTAEEDKITLSGLLNFIDGLWSSCGDERIIVFTSNHKDPLLLRPGRTDVHLEMSYCSFSGFRTLASNYLKIEDHKLYGVIEELLGNVQATPADVAGELVKSDNADIALQSLIRHLQSKETELDQSQTECSRDN
ncbi:unnamed protein product [Ilex paraguariensis]|uniref:AAA+ ATPase domain-containing protein n=1 Tax=Ilex paraguariensis TaxID=185542 RepID=A0ABC8U9Q4_9AQUA